MNEDDREEEEEEEFVVCLATTEEDTEIEFADVIAIATLRSSITCKHPLHMLFWKSRVREGCVQSSCAALCLCCAVLH